MEEKKFDPYQFIGFILIALIMTWMLMNQQPVEEGTDVVTTTETQAETAQEVAVVKNDSIQRIQLQNNFGSFADLVQEQEASEITLENEVLSFVFSNKGGQIIKAHLKGYTNYLGEPLNLVEDNQNINFTFSTLDGRTLNTADFYFIPALTEVNNEKVLTLKAALNESQWIAFRYALSSNDFMVDFSILTNGMKGIINQNKAQSLSWDLKALRNSRSVEYENRYTELTYGYEGEKVNELSIALKISSLFKANIN